MLDAARLAIAFAGGRTRDEFAHDEMLQSAVLYQVQVVGEAARHVSETTRSRHPDVPWTDIVGMRNRLVHGCSAVDVERVWMTVEADLPELVRLIEGILGSS